MLTVGIFLLWIFSNTPYDDAFIYFRYAFNALDGQGFVFNKGQWVEGYTGILWLLIVTLFTWLHWPLFLTVITAGALSWFGTFSLLLKFSKKIFNSTLIPVLTVFLFVIQLPNGIWAVAGLETSLYQFLLIISIYFSINEKNSDFSDFLAGALFFCASLCRVEGIGIYTAIWLLKLNEYFNFKKIKNIAPFSVGILAYFIYLFIRFKYYNHILPNTYFAKSNTFDIQTMLDGWRYCRDYYVTCFGNWIIVIVFFGVSCINGFMHKWWRYLFTSLLTGTILVCLGGGNNLPFWRYMVPYSPMAILIFVHGYRTVYVMYENLNKLWRKYLQIFLFAILVIVSRNNLITVFDNMNFIEFKKNNRVFFETSKLYGNLFNQFVHEEMGIALNAIPMTSFFYHGHVIDMLGLTDEHIAHAPVKMKNLPHGHRKGDGNYILSLKPAVIILGGGPYLSDTPIKWNIQPIYPSDFEILASDDFYELYEPININFQGRYINFFWRKELKLDMLQIDNFLKTQPSFNPALLSTSQENIFRATQRLIFGINYP